MTRLQQLRESRGWSQSELARRADVPRTSLIRWENGEHTPKADALRRLARAFSVPLEHLMDEVAKGA